MDKWRSKGKAVANREDSLLPSTRRITSAVSSPPLLDKRRNSKKWSIDGFFKRVSSILDTQNSSASPTSTSSSLEESLEKRTRKIKGRPKDVVAPTAPGYVPHLKKFGEDLANANMNNHQQQQQHHHQATLETLEARLSNSRSSDGSTEDRRTHREKTKTRVEARREQLKARVEARRDQLCIGDSSMDESSNEDVVVDLAKNNGHRNNESGGKKWSRASRTERYLKRICNGNGNKINCVAGGSNVADSRNLEGRGYKDREFQPIERVPQSDYAQNVIGVNNGNVYPQFCHDNDVSNENFYSRQSDIGVNPLVQQTLQYFSEFDRNMAASQFQKSRKTYPGHHQHSQHHRHHRRGHKSHDPPEAPPPVIPPKPPSRDHRCRILVNGMTLDKYLQMLQVQKPPDYSTQQLDEENGFRPNPSRMRSPDSTVHKFHFTQHLQNPNFGEPYNKTKVGNENFMGRNQSPLLDINKSKFVDQSSSHFTPILQSNDFENSNCMSFLKNEIEEETNERRSSKNLEEALFELEAMYNRLQLDDEELLDRAEKRTLEEFHYKGFTASPDIYNEDLALRRKTWGDQSQLNKENGLYPNTSPPIRSPNIHSPNSTMHKFYSNQLEPHNMGNFKEEPELPDRLKDDMAYRRMHPKERPSSVDGQSSLSSISYLMTSPIPSRREICCGRETYIDPKRKPRKKEPDVTLDDVVFRSMLHANNILKVIDPQPPFGIPLGPITTATDSDYLHTNPTKPERARSPYIPSCEPDIVTDDLAFRNLRKDAQLQSRQSSPSFLGGVCDNSNARSPQHFGLKKKRAVRSLSANLYGLINKAPAPSKLDFDNEDVLSINTNSTFDDIFNNTVTKRFNRRISDPEVVGWQRNTWEELDINRNREKEEKIQRATEQRRDNNSSDVDGSSRSYDESSDERIEPRDRLILGERDIECKVASDKGSSYISSNCSTPPLPPPRPTRNVEPVSEQEISVYKKLCQDLENLVQLTRSIDAMPEKSDSIVPPLQRITKDLSVPVEPEGKESVSSKPKETITKFNNIEKVGRRNGSDNEAECKNEVDTFSIKCDITTLLDSLKNLAEISYRSNSSCTEEIEERKVDDKKKHEETKKEEKKEKKDKEEEKEEEEEEEEQQQQEEEEAKKEIVVDEKSFKEITKEICDLAAGIETKTVMEEDRKMMEDEESKDILNENVFFKNVQIAKLSGDWKESTPNNNNNSSINRRTSLTSADNAHWEGEIRSCERVSMVCNASHDMSRLTAKYICYITNHITAQFCLLLVFFLVLLLAIVTVP